MNSTEISSSIGVWLDPIIKSYNWTSPARCVISSRWMKPIPSSVFRSLKCPSLPDEYVRLPDIFGILYNSVNGKLTAIYVGPEQQHLAYYCKTYVRDGSVSALSVIEKLKPVSDWSVGSVKLHFQKERSNLVVASLSVNWIGALWPWKGRHCCYTNLAIIVSKAVVLSSTSLSKVCGWSLWSLSLLNVGPRAKFGTMHRSILQEPKNYLSSVFFVRC